eukprot:TRINITY_DN22073_c0_g1_i1.p1 TRINITY_DN22073_c0_g1~~TRINITY_DN22073_c0_g1_i1.p1  ORF type:complete len:388 (-),score=73.00 TRINITY_DN22073_c0_g1_i1:92-1255(-)
MADGSTMACLRIPGTRRRIYEVWPAKSQFFFGGRCMTGGGPQIGFVTWLCLVVPFGIYMAASALPAFAAARQAPSGLAAPLAALALLALALSLLAATCCTDPGVIPRRSVIIAAGLADELKATLGYDVLETASDPSPGEEAVAAASATAARRPVSQRDLKVPEALRGRGYRWCETCEIVRPPRAAHCRACDQCVLRFDHHCPWMNNCVAQRNYRFFVGFLFVTTVLAVFVLPAVAMALPVGPDAGALSAPSTAPTATAFLGPSSTRSSTTIDESAQGSPTDGGILGVTMLIFVVSIGVVALGALMLLCYHLFLTSSGQTTREHLQRNKEAKRAGTGGPTVFGARGPRLFDPRALVSLSAAGTSFGLLSSDDSSEDSSTTSCACSSEG